ncbi:unnamed protein product [Heligmosomoides polygyrus]|uniref:Uncharacterized protein n=1 Tax=Heligmosomoides polygyrus TaxID=6339 RepID=A0A3P8CIX5_HELPZ|nr:unnamed protein product [Heligmosomoides polygyrus]
MRTHATDVVQQASGFRRGVTDAVPDLDAVLPVKTLDCDIVGEAIAANEFELKNPREPQRFINSSAYCRYSNIIHKSTIGIGGGDVTTLLNGMPREKIMRTVNKLGETTYGCSAHNYRYSAFGDHTHLKLICLYRWGVCTASEVLLFFSICLTSAKREENCNNFNDTYVEWQLTSIENYNNGIGPHLVLLFFSICLTSAKREENCNNFNDTYVEWQLTSIENYNNGIGPHLSLDCDIVHDAASYGNAELGNPEGGTVLDAAKYCRYSIVSVSRPVSVPVEPPGFCTSRVEQPISNVPLETFRSRLASVICAVVQASLRSSPQLYTRLVVVGESLESLAMSCKTPWIAKAQ